MKRRAGHGGSRSCLLVAVGLCWIGGAPASAEDLQPGEVIERVVCQDDASQSYALYLPRAYSSERAWPVLYAFHARARGAVPVQLYQEAAERLGFVVAGSNNSRNGPLAVMHEAARAMIGDTQARLNLDGRRVYTTGMSGGTWPALGVAITYAAGVIACGGPISGETLPEGFSVDWLGIAGSWDFNYGHTRSAVRAIRDRGGVARFMTFEGGHAWPPAETAAAALEWLALRAMQRGHAPVEAGLVEAFAARGERNARALIDHGDVADAAEEYATLAAELDGLRPTAELRAEAARLHADPRFARDVKRQQLVERRFQAQTQQIARLRSQAVGRSADRSLRRNLEHRVTLLQRDAESTDRETRLLSRRVLDWARIDAITAAFEARTAGKTDLAVTCFEIWALIRPEDAEPLYHAAATLAAAGQCERALAEVRKAVDLGFAAAERIESDASWDACRGSEGLQTLLASPRATPSSP